MDSNSETRKYLAFAATSDPLEFWDREEAQEEVEAFDPSHFSNTLPWILQSSEKHN